MKGNIMSTEKNQEALAIAFKQIGVHLDKIEELNIAPDMNEESVDALVKTLSEDKALNECKGTWKDYVKGQRFYVESLIRDCNLEPQALVDYHYKRAFSEVATEEEMLGNIEERIAARNAA